MLASSPLTGLAEPTTVSKSGSNRAGTTASSSVICMRQWCPGNTSTERPVVVITQHPLQIDGRQSVVVLEARRADACAQQACTNLVPVCAWIHSGNARAGTVSGQGRRPLLGRFRYPTNAHPTMSVIAAITRRCRRCFHSCCCGLSTVESSRQATSRRAITCQTHIWPSHLAFAVMALRCWPLSSLSL